MSTISLSLSLSLSSIHKIQSPKICRPDEFLFSFISRIGHWHCKILFPISANVVCMRAFFLHLYLDRVSVKYFDIFPNRPSSHSLNLAGIHFLQRPSGANQFHGVATSARYFGYNLMKHRSVVPHGLEAVSRAPPAESINSSRSLSMITCILCRWGWRNNTPAISI